MKKSSQNTQANLFLAHFDQLLNPKHPLVILADKIDWNRFEVALADCYSPDFGRPAKSTRLMVGMLYLKHTFSISDEDLPVLWVENPYWQYFCGYSYMQHEMPFEYTTLIKWRKKVGAERLTLLLKETIELAVKEKHLDKKNLASVNIDTTVQEKNITPPTDAKLLRRAIEKLASAAKARKLPLRQSFLRVCKKLSIKAGRYAHARQFKRMNKSLKKLKTFLGRLLRDVERKCAGPDEGLSELLSLCKRLHQQQRTDKNKLYSLHEPEVQCISKGKANKRYEFGNKVSVATTNRENWIVGSRSLEGNPYDGKTLSVSISQIESLTGTKIKEAFVDKGYRGHDYTGEAAIHISGVGRGASRALKKRKKRRSAIEPKIGHLKSENRMDRCFLKGTEGDAINAVLAAAGSNFRKLLRLTASFFALLFLGRIFFQTESPTQNIRPAAKLRAAG